MNDVSTLASIEPLAREWDDLAVRTGAPPFLRPGWMEIWWRAFGRGRLEIAALRRDGQLAGVAPLHRRRGAVHAVANVHSPWFGLVAEDARAERALAEWIFDRGALRVSLPQLDAGASGAAELARAARAAGRRLTTTTIRRSPRVVVDGDWERFEDGLSRKSLSDLRRRRRLLEHEGALTLEVADGRERLPGLLDEIFRIEPSGWKAARGTSIVSQPRTHGFYSGLAEWAAREGFLRLAFLRLDGRAIACQYALEDGRSWWALKGGFDPAYRRFGPTKLLVHALLERAFALGLDSFELLGADEPWKRMWNPVFREIVLQDSVRRSPAGLAVGTTRETWRTVGRPLAKRVVALWR